MVKARDEAEKNAAEEKKKKSDELEKPGLPKVTAE